jgi:hypothetical protein
MGSCIAVCGRSKAASRYVATTIAVSPATLGKSIADSRGSNVSTIDQPGLELKNGDELKVTIETTAQSSVAVTSWFYCKVIAGALKDKRPVLFGKPRDLARRLARDALEKVMLDDDRWTMNVVDSIEQHCNRYDNLSYYEHVNKLKTQTKVLIPMTVRGSTTMKPSTSSLEIGLLEFDRMAGDDAADLAREYCKVYKDQLECKEGCGMISGKSLLDPSYSISAEDSGAYVRGIGSDIYLMEDSSTYGTIQGVMVEITHGTGGTLTTRPVSRESRSRVLSGKMGSIYRIISIIKLDPTKLW